MKFRHAGDACPFLSVLLTIYKEPKEWIKESIESILNQTFECFELFLINDNPNSTINKQIIVEYEMRDSRVRGIFNEKNVGLPASLNKGIFLAKGKYIARMDADDISLPERFEKQIYFLENHPEVGICGTYAKIISDTSKNGKPLINHETDAEIKSALLFYCPFVHPSVMGRTSIFRDNLYDTNCRIAQDFELWLRIANKTKFYNIPEFLLNYRIHNKQSRTNLDEKQLRLNQYYLIDKIMDYYVIDSKYREVFTSIFFLSKVSVREVKEFFRYLINNKFNSLSYDYLVQRYIEIEFVNKHYFNAMMNPLSSKHPLRYLKAFTKFLRKRK